MGDADADGILLGRGRKEGAMDHVRLLLAMGMVI